MKLWIARDKDGMLYLYENVPERHEEYFLPNKGFDYMDLDNRLFPEITFNNSPQEVELKLI